VVQPVDHPEDVDAYAAGAEPWVASVQRDLGLRLVPGLGGLGLTGTGLGGGGIGLGTIGTRGYGGGVGVLGGKRGHIVQTQANGPIVYGSLDKGLIQRAIKARQNEVRYCYELELTRNWELSGRLMIELTIENGKVVSAKAVDDEIGEAVANCVLARARTWRFPMAPGGGTVVVRYPWVFSKAVKR
jgi:hypothetical protein